jgi:hypothetical protein
MGLGFSLVLTSRLLLGDKNWMPSGRAGAIQENKHSFCGLLSCCQCLGKEHCGVNFDRDFRKFHNVRVEIA